MGSRPNLPSPERYAKYLKAAEMKKAGASRQEIAAEIGMHPSTVDNWLVAGKGVPQRPPFYVGAEAPTSKADPIIAKAITLNKQPLTGKRSNRMMFLAYGPEDTVTLCLDNLLQMINKGEVNASSSKESL